MKYTFLNRQIKTKILLGIVVVIGAIVAASAFTYHSFNQMLQAMDTLSKPEAKLVLLNEVMTDISNAEGSARAYTLTKEREYLRNYWEQFSTIEARIHRIEQEMQGNAYQLARIDSVSALLGNKQRNLQAFLQLKKKESEKNPLKKALEIIDQKAQDAPTSSSPQQPIARVSPEVPHQQGYPVSRAAPAKRQRKKQADVDETNTNQADALLDDVKDIISDIESEDLRMKASLGKQELDIIEQDWLIMDQIRSIIRDVRREELLLAETNAARARHIATSSVSTITMVGGVVILGSLLFLIMVFKDLASSNYYRKNLIRAKKHAEMMARVKEEFLTNMSHEIRTPLNAITGFLEQLKKTTLDRDQYLYVNTIDSSSEHLLSIVNDILDLSKIESGKLTLNEQPFTVKRVMQTVVEVMRLKAKEKKITLSREIDPILDIPLEGDAHRLRQILFNLVGNAVKFTDQGGVAIQARTKDVTETHVTVEFLVKDTGAGIAHNKLGHIFGAFNQEEEMTSFRYGGTGLGLSICKKLIELQNGWIAVESKVGQGSTFSFAITYRKSTSPVVTMPRPARYTTEDFSDKTILVVDDDQVNRLLLEVLSENWKARVDIVDGGISALSAMSQTRYDMVLTDINMPEMNGVELMTRIKERYPTTPVIAFTATGQSETLNEFLKQGFDDYLLKPFKESDLCAKIVQHTTEQTALAEAVPPPTTPTQPTPAFSLAELTLITRNNPKKLFDILHLFLERCPQEVEQLIQATHQQHWSKLANIAHKLRSPFGQIKADALVDELHFIEKKASQPNPKKRELQRATQLFAAQAQVIFDRLEAEMLTVGQAL
jgi:signal transduction histidine kinase/DNA-binding response OmpR family regulator